MPLLTSGGLGLGLVILDLVLVLVLRIWSCLHHCRKQPSVLSQTDCFSPCEFVGVHVILNCFYPRNMSGCPCIIERTTYISLDDVCSAFAHDVSYYCVDDVNTVTQRYRPIVLPMSPKRLVTQPSVT